uniref:Uncharacterized protein n=1 Tax=Ditylenchus dipsaci TaxID=166011 RepID=A0A915ENR6_9BILA
MSTTCLQSTLLAATIFGAIAGTLLLCLLFLALLFYWARSKEWVKFDFPLLEKSSTNCTNNKSNELKGPLTTSRVHPLMAKETRVTGVDEVDGQQLNISNFNKESHFTVQMQPSQLRKKAANMEDDLVDVVGFSIAQHAGSYTHQFVVENVDVAAVGKFSKGDRLVSIRIDVNKMCLDEVDTIFRTLAAVPYSLEVERTAGNHSTARPIQSNLSSHEPKASVPVSLLNLSTTLSTSHCSPNGSFGAVTVTAIYCDAFIVNPKFEEIHEMSTIPTAINSQPPSLPSGSPPLSFQEEEVVELEATSPAPVASPNNSSSPVLVRLRQKRQLIEGSPSRSNEAVVDPASPDCNTRMGFLKDQKEEEVAFTTKAVELDSLVVVQQPQSVISCKKVELELNDSKPVRNGVTTKAMNKDSQKTSAESEDSRNYQNIDISPNKDAKTQNGKAISTQNSILSLEQCGTLEANRKRLERERQQLRQLGII